MTTTQQEKATGGPRLTLHCRNCGKWNRIRADKASDGPKCGSCGTALTIDHPVMLDDATFDRVIAETEVPILVDFYADWCGPCKMMAPAVETLARESVGRALVAKLDTDAAQRTASRFHIRGIPTSIVFMHGKEIKRQTGAVPLATLRAMLS
ncbi:MAG: thioredoxin [Gemmatimonadetes bacterium]|nr:thioredoxin [Gemmatimonadota bacterium]